MLASNWNQTNGFHKLLLSWAILVMVIFFVDVWVRRMHVQAEKPQVEFSTLIKKFYTFLQLESVLIRFGIILWHAYCITVRHFSFLNKYHLVWRLVTSCKDMHVFYVWLLYPHTFWDHTICLYTHFDYTPIFSITQFSLLSQEHLNRMWKIVSVIVYMHGCVRVCPEGIIW